MPCPTWTGTCCRSCNGWARAGVPGAVAQAVARGRVRLNPEVCKLLGHLVARGNDLVRSRRHPDVPASTNRLEGWFGHLKFRARLTRGLKTEAAPATAWA